MKKDRFGKEQPDEYFDLDEISKPVTPWDIAAHRVQHRDMEQYGQIEEDYLERIRDEVKIVKREQAKAERKEQFRQCFEEVRAGAGENPIIKYLISDALDLMQEKHGKAPKISTGWTYYRELFPKSDK